MNGYRLLCIENEWIYTIVHGKLMAMNYCA